MRPTETRFFAPQAWVNGAWAYDVLLTADATGHWSGFVKHMDRIVYKSELPFYPDYIQDEEHHEERHEPKKPAEPAPSPKRDLRNAPDPKTSMGKILSGFKVEE